jgi:hypothetical protein
MVDEIIYEGIILIFLLDLSQLMPATSQYILNASNDCECYFSNMTYPIANVRAGKRAKSPMYRYPASLSEKNFPRPRVDLTFDP